MKKGTQAIIDKKDKIQKLSLGSVLMSDLGEIIKADFSREEIFIINDREITKKEWSEIWYFPEKYEVNDNIFIDERVNLDDSPNQTVFYVSSTSNTEWFTTFEHIGDFRTIPQNIKTLIRHNLVHYTEQAAVLHSNAIICFMNGE